MHVKTADTLWPDTVSPSVKDSIETFFQLLDGHTPEAGKQWSELYLPEGKFEAFGQTFTGHESGFTLSPSALSCQSAFQVPSHSQKLGVKVIRNHILRFWDSFPGLNHVPAKVYLHRAQGLDVAVITAYEITFPGGYHVAGESVAMLEFVEQNGRLLLASNRLILDPNPLMAGLEAQSSKPQPIQSLAQGNKAAVVHEEHISG
ncbi:hypothetical protein Asppvi_007063 [Aspergillus pseudoviridinutans]|uniref:Uncharacterized protein n=1 Tax=Aspergillus pseudoviridinutans TaxID=1517512 RepID=A0A9P3BI45_9EURO|nr:uncharacterized protein Asppvi_007063 [Aspergillus pseudoviridinutans]GIJ88146.1 hypothetical protein Asppvi_007063 [Aspergillus pseudoviridinutans]